MCLHSLSFLTSVFRTVFDILLLPYQYVMSMGVWSKEDTFSIHMYGKICTFRLFRELYVCDSWNTVNKMRCAHVPVSSKLCCSFKFHRFSEFFYQHCYVNTFEARPTSHKARMLKSSVDERRLPRRRSKSYLNGNERDFWKILKKSGMDVRSWNFFYVKIQPSSKREKNFSFVRPFLIFLQFFKNRSWNFFHI